MSAATPSASPPWSSTRPVRSSASSVPRSDSVEPTVSAGTCSMPNAAGCTVNATSPSRRSAVSGSSTRRSTRASYGASTRCSIASAARSPENRVLPCASGYSPGRTVQSSRPLVAYAPRGTTFISPDTSKSGPLTTSSRSSSRSASTLPARLARSIDNGSAFGFGRKRSVSTEALPTRTSTARSMDSGNRNGSGAAAPREAGRCPRRGGRAARRRPCDRAAPSGFQRSSTRSTRSSSVCRLHHDPTERERSGEPALYRCDRDARRQSRRDALPDELQAALRARCPEQHAGRDEQRGERDRAPTPTRT